MGSFGRSLSYKNNDTGTKIIFFSKTNSEGKSPRQLSHSGDHAGSHGDKFSPKMGRKTDCSGDSRSLSDAFLNPFHETKEKREIETDHRSIRVKQIISSGKIQNGDSGSDCQDHSGHHVGMLGGHRGCLLPRTNTLGLPQISGIQDQEQGLCLPVPPIRIVASTLGLHKGHQTSKGQVTFVTHSHLQLHRRFHSIRRVSGDSEPEGSDCVAIASVVRVQDQLGQVPADAYSGHRVSRCSVGFEEQNSVCTKVKGCGDCEAVQGDCHGEQVNKAYVRETVGEAGLRSSLCQTGQVISASSVNLDESSHWDGDKRCARSPGQLVQKPFESVGERGLLESTSSLCGESSGVDSDDRCLVDGLVRSPSAPTGDGVLGSRRGTPVHQLEGIDGSEVDPAESQGRVGRPLHSTPVGQHDYCVLSQKTGVSTQRGTAWSYNSNLGVLQGKLHSPHPRTSQGSVQRFGGPGLQSESGVYRMESGCENVQMDLRNVSVTRDRSVCYEDKYPFTPVCVTLPRRGCGGLRRVQPGLEPLEGDLLVSPIQGHRESPTQAGHFSGIRGHDRSLLAISELVPPTVHEMHGTSDSVTSRSFSVSTDIEGSSEVSQSQRLEPSRLDTVISFLPDGCSEITKDVFLKAHSVGTIRQYQGSWGKFLDFLRVNNVSHRDITISHVMNFLAFCSKDLGLQYRTVATYKCSLEFPLKICFNLSLDSLIFRLFMRGIFNIRPPLKASPGPSWLLDIQLSYLRLDVFEPLFWKSKLIKTSKLLCLLLLATGRRIGEISNLSLRHDVLRRGRAMRLHLLKGARTKVFTAKFIPKPPIVEALDLRPGIDSILCPVRALNIYFEALDPSKRFVNTVRFWDFSCSQLSGIFRKCVSDALSFAHLPTDVKIGPHQVRKLAASYSKPLVDANPSLKKKLYERMGSNGLGVLEKVYIQEVPQLDTVCVLPVGTFFPPA